MPPNKRSNSQHTPRRDLRGSTRLPARYRQDHQENHKVTYSASPHQTCETPAEYQPAIDSPMHPSTITVRTRESSESSRLSHSSSLRRRRISSRPAFKPSKTDEQRRADISTWLAQDNSWGRWGEAWDEVGTVADLHEIRLALHGRAMRACGERGMKAIDWLAAELADIRTAGVDKGGPSRTRILRTLKGVWQEYCEQIFGEDSEPFIGQVRAFTQQVVAATTQTPRK